MTNDEIYNRIVSLRKNNPKMHAITRIALAYESAKNKAAEIRKKGKGDAMMEQFADTLSNLKTTIRSMKENFGLTNCELKEWCDQNGHSYKLCFNLNQNK